MAVDSEKIRKIVKMRYSETYTNGAVYLAANNLVAVEGVDYCKVSGISNVIAVSHGVVCHLNLGANSVQYSYLFLDKRGSVYHYQYVPANLEGYKNSRVHLWDNICGISNKGYHAMGLRKDGTVVVDDEEVNQQVSSWRNVVAIASGGDEYDYNTFRNQNPGFWLGLTADGRVLAYGNNHFGQCEARKWKDIVSIDAYNNYALGVCKDGTVLACGKNYENRCNVSSWRNIVDVSTSFNLSLGLRNDGTVVATKNVPGLPSLRNIVGVSGSCCFRNDGVAIKVYSDGCHIYQDLYHNPVKIAYTRKEREEYEARKDALKTELAKLQNNLSNATGFFQKDYRRQLEEEIKKVQSQLSNYPDL